VLIRIATLSMAEPPAMIEFSKPSTKTVIAVFIFILASGIQHDCHAYLASLTKYTFPEHHLFQSVLCPHYTSECFIYIAIAIAAAPQGYAMNRTVLSGLGFVISNLAVTADSTRRWYLEKFGPDQFKGRMRMLPYVY
jgi:3-oxo-5-alpha-steroid 4-dehydrogenase 3